jgi:hypothetical protein
LPASSMARTVMALRMRQQRISREGFVDPSKVVAWLGAMQAQDYQGAKWAVALRMREQADETIERAFADGRILRTHVMRPTWHFVTPEDIRWLLELTAPRVNASNAYMYRQVGLDNAVFARSNAAISRALEGERYLTRGELGQVLAQAGVAAKGVRLTYVMMRAELDGVVCSGPRRGRQFTYALLDERAPTARRLKREEAVAEIVLRYFTGHGPAAIRDFVWWSGLTAGDAKEALKAAGSDLARELVEGESLWSSATARRRADAPREAFLLPTYDELLVGYASFDESRRGGKGARNRLVYSSPVLLGSTVVGSWRRSVKKGVVLVQVAPFSTLLPAESEAVVAAAERYGRFVGLRTVCTISGGPDGR